MRELQFHSLVVRECHIFQRNERAVLGIGFDTGSVGARMTLIQIHADRQSIAVFSDIAAARGPGTQELPLDGYVPLSGLGISVMFVLTFGNIICAHHGRVRPPPA